MEFRNLLEDAVKSLNICPNKLYINKVTYFDNSVDIPIEKFKNHPSIKASKENITINEGIEFYIEEVSNICEKYLIRTATRSWWQLRRLCSKPTSRIREI